MHRFYCPDIASTLTLGEEDSKHCVKVLRMVEGDTIEVVDGQGMLYVCRITMAHHKRCAVEVIDERHMPPHWDTASCWVSRRPKIWTASSGS